MLIRPVEALDEVVSVGVTDTIARDVLAIAAVVVVVSVLERVADAAIVVVAELICSPVPVVCIVKESLESEIVLAFVRTIEEVVGVPLELSARTAVLLRMAVTEEKGVRLLTAVALTTTAVLELITNKVLDG